MVDPGWRATWIVLVLALSASTLGAAPSLRGGTGLINTPTAFTQTGTSFYYLGGKGSTNGVWSTQGRMMEGGLLNRDGDNFYNFKVKFIPEFEEGGFFIPATAVGMRGLSDLNNEREYYLALSKQFSYPKSMVTAGATRSVTFKGDTSYFGGIEVPIMTRGRIIGEYDGKAGAFNAGVGLYVSDSWYLYQYNIDLRNKSVDRSKSQVFGVCFQTQF